MIKEVNVKSILSSYPQVDAWFGCKYNMNLYRGCQHQCIYCDSRSECYRIENFNDIIVKINAIELLEKELKSKRIVGTIGFGAMCDTYMPVEKEYKLTRKALELALKYKFPVHIITKSDLVTRDIDLLKEISKIYAAISFTITTTDDNLAKIIEPNSSPPSKRLIAMKMLSDTGIYTGVTMMPILPFLEDTEENILSIVQQSKSNGAKYIIPAIGMTLRDRQRDYYYNQLDKHFPNLKNKYIKTFGNRYSCSPLNSKRLYQILKSECEKQKLPMKINIFEPVNIQSIGQSKLF
jgi:DNA repair photolyase